MAKPDWTCGTCTLLNPATKRRCQVCNSRRPVATLPVKKVATDSKSNDTTTTPESRSSSIPRFEPSLTQRMAIVVTTTKASKRREILAEGLIAAVGTIANGCQKNNLATRMERASKTKTSRKRPRPSTPQNRPYSSLPISYDCNGNGSISNDDNLLPKAVGWNSVDKSDEHTREISVDGTFVTNPLTENNDPKEKDEMLQFQSVENSKSTSSDSNANIIANSNNSNSQELLTVSNKPCSDTDKYDDMDENKTETNLQDSPGNETEPSTNPTASVLMENTIRSSSTREENEIVEPRKKREVNESSPAENKPIDTKIGNRSINQQQTDHVENTTGINTEKIQEKIEIENSEPAQQKLTPLATTVAATVADTTIQQYTGCATAEAVPTSPPAMTCNGNMTDSTSTIAGNFIDSKSTDGAEASATEVSTSPTKSSPVSIDAKGSEITPDKQSCAIQDQCEVDALGACTTDNTPTKTNNSEREEYMSQVQSEMGSQSSFLNGPSSCFAYTPPGVGMASQTSEKELSQACELEEDTPAKARLQDSFPCEESREGQQQQGCKDESVNKNQQSPSLPFPPSHPPNLQASDCETSTEETDRPSSSYASANVRKCINGSSVERLREGVAPTVSTEECNSVGTTLTESLEAVSSICEEQHKPLSKPSSKTIPTTKSFAGMFRTAGSGSSIAVSEEKVKEMGRILDRPSSSKKESIPPLMESATKSSPGMFRTAGSGSSITVSEEKVKEMARILDRPSYSSITSIQPSKESTTKSFAGMFHTAGSGSSIAVSEEKVKEMARILEKPSSKKEYTQPLKTTSEKSFTGMFQTAGSGSSIAVSEEKVNEMARILEKPSSKKEYTQPLTKTINKSFTGMFQTAGSGSSIVVSEAKVKEMGIILDKPSSSKKGDIQPLTKTINKSFTGLFQTAGSGASIVVSEEKVKEMGEILDQPSTSRKESNQPSETSRTSFTAAFQTAGSGASIVVSEEKVNETARIFDRPSSSSNESSQSLKVTSSAKTPLTGIFQTAGSGTSIVVSEEKVKEIGRMLDQPSSRKESVLPPEMTPATKRPFTGMFHTAGSGTSIAVSEEKVKEMGIVLDRPSSRKESVLPPEMTPATKRPFTGMFHTAGSGTSIAVSEEKVKEMGMILGETSSTRKESIKPLNIASATKRPFTGMFQSAGSGTSIAVSEEKVKEMGMILGRPSSSKKGSIFPLRKTSPTFLDNTTTVKKPRRDDSLMVDVMPTPTPMASFHTPRLVTAAKNDLLISTVQTARSSKTTEVSEEAVEEMGALLKQPSSSRDQLTEKKIPRSQDYTKVTDLADKNNRQRSLANPDHQFVETNLRSYPHSPLRTNDSKSSNINCDAVAYTPLIESKATPNNQFVRVSSLTRLAYGVTPSSIPKLDNAPPSCVTKDGMTQLQSSAENQELHCNAVDMTLRKHDAHLSRNESKIPHESANVTGFGDDVPHGKRQVVKDVDMTPVPIDVNGKMDTLDEEVIEQIESTRGESSSDSSLCQTLEDSIRYGIMSNCPSMCRVHGVREATMLVNCNNSLQLRFDLDGRPQAFESNEEVKSPNTLGRLLDIRQSLIDEGYDITRVNDRWIRNHTRWIIWKLASYERRFSRFLAGSYLTYHNLVRNLLLRFQQEVMNGVRPAVRKIMNRDAAASRMMILVVCQILSSSKVEGDGASSESNVLELSDGWYSVRGCLDSKLSQFVNDGLIAVGTKLLISNARLVGAEEGVDPLDDGDGTGCQSCKATLQLTANATRLARWNAKLGFVKNTSRKQMPHGHLLVKRISDIVPGGGNIPAIRLFIQRVYPLLYYEKYEHSDATDHDSTANFKRRVFTEQEEDARRRTFEAKKLRVVEKLTDRIQGEVEQEVDENAPEAWKRIMNSTTPEDIYESLTNDEKFTISRWKEKRSSLINRRVREEVESELELETSLVRESTSFLRVKVHSIDPKKNCNEGAMLTIWQPTEEQTGFLNEGVSVEIHNLAVRESSFDGISQLVANSRTIIEPFAFDASSLTEKIGFRHRRFLNLLDVHKISHESSNDKGGKMKTETFDVAAVQIHVQVSDVPDDFTFYLSDETNLFLRVHCRNPPSTLKSLLLSESQSFPTYALRDLFIRPFDHEEQCAVAEFCEMSSVILTNNRLENLSEWVASSSEGEIQLITAYIKAGLPLWESDCKKNKFLGYVMGVRSESTEKLYIQVDCCGQGSFEWKVPADVLREMLSSISSVTLQESVFADSTERASYDRSLSSIFRSKSILWRFQVLSEPEVAIHSAIRAEKQNIGNLYKALQYYSE